MQVGREEVAGRGGTELSTAEEKKKHYFPRPLDSEDFEKAVPSVRENQGCMKTHLLLLLRWQRLAG